MTVTIDGAVIETPAHDKLQKLNGKNQPVRAFVEWLLGMYSLGNWISRYDFQEARVTIDDLLAQYYGISSSELEQEKAAIMRALRGER